MKKVQIDEYTQGLLDKIVALKKEVEALNCSKLLSDNRAAVVEVLVDKITADAIHDAQSAEALALVAYIAAKSCHVTARIKKEIDLIVLAEKADAATKDVYTHAVKHLELSKQGQTKGGKCCPE